MDNAAYQEDLNYFYSKLIKHPLFILKPEMLPVFETLFRSRIENQINDINYIDTVTQLTVFFHDGHTNVELPYTYHDKCLNISCCWYENRLFLLNTYEDMESGSEILSIDNRTIPEIIAFMSNRIPHENIYLVKSRMINYPYKNYHVFSEMNLKYMFGDKDSFQICFLKNGKRVIRNCVLQTYNSYLDFRDEDPVSYEIVDQTAVLHLNTCVCNEDYLRTLSDLADLCDKGDIKSLILDLSNNMGGSSAVIDEFIKYVNIDEFKRYEMIDYSLGTGKYITRRTDIVKNYRHEKTFPPNIYCLVSHDTFSSARTFAVTLKDNGIAKITGTPTGGKPNSFGMPQKFQMPNSGVAFRVSRALFLRPNMADDNEITLLPDS